MEELEQKYTRAKEAVEGDPELLRDLIDFNNTRMAAYSLRKMREESEGNLRNKIEERLNILEKE